MPNAYCSICGANWFLQTSTCRSKPYIGKQLPLYQCHKCGFTRLLHDQAKFDHVVDSEHLVHDNLLRSSRNASEERPGREFHMSIMGAEILLNSGANVDSVTYFGAGLNTDHIWSQKALPGIDVKLVDLVNHQDHPKFEKIENATKSSLVIACEVIEHFSHPLEHFDSLFKIVKDDGLLICSTNINDGTDIEGHMYPFISGHTAYWSPLSLIKVAANFGYFIDFRTPKICYSKNYPRKRYILFFKRSDISFSIAEYFGSKLTAPSE